MGKKSKKKSKPKPSAGVENNIHHHQRQHELSTNRERIITEQLGSLTLDAVEKALADGAACYFCLDEGPDETGKPVVRDCSCRGNDAGFAHLSCMIKYAEQKSKSLVGKSNFGVPWHLCLSCKQPFKNQLALEMTSAFISFTESTYGHPRQSINDKICVMIALRLRIVTIVDCKKEYMMNNRHATFASIKEAVPVDEGKMLGKKLLSMVEQIKKEKQIWKMMEIRCEFEARTYTYLGVLNSDCHELCIAYYEKARDIFQLLGVKDEAKAAQSSIDAYRASSTRCNDSDSLLNSLKSIHEHNIEVVGSTSEHTIRFGLNYAEQLQKVHHSIEAERLVMKLAADCRRVHGPEHNCTATADALLEKCKKRFVYYDEKIFEALRYEDDGEICVVTGPVTEPRQADKEQILRVAGLTVPKLGCVVVCTGLVSSPHLNGKLGDVRDGKLVGDGLQLSVHFEDAELKSAWIKSENLRIVFELPGKESD
jgi:hypothetical protein